MADESKSMADESKSRTAWLIAVSPGMGHVAISAGYYLMAKLGMKQVAEFSSEEFFDLDYIEVKNGLIATGRRPRSRFFKWENPEGEPDILLFIGEAQPPQGKYAFCQKIIDYARQQNVERVFTFAAMATQMHPESPSRIFCAATDGEHLRELQRLEIEPLEDGNISGLNGILLGVAVDAGMRGTCLLGEIPHLFSQFPFPKASLVVLEVFSAISKIAIDLEELREHSEVVEHQLGQAFAQIEKTMGERLQEAEEPDEEFAPESPSLDDQLHGEDLKRIENLFQQAEQDRSKAYELKRELDRLEAFKEYEDRFLDLFRKPDA